MAGDPFGLVGYVIDGQFHVEDVVGEGGFSVVYRARHLGLQEPVALKCLKIKKTRDPRIIENFTKRFWDEGRILYRLSQDNFGVCRSLASGATVAPKTGDTGPYMALEWLEGASLAADFRARRAQHMKGRTWGEIVALFGSAAEALAHAHAQGIVHRDVKPGNLFLQKTRTGVRMKVLDFGMAKIFDDEAAGMPQGALTIGAVMVISPHYSPPELFDPKVGPVGPWTDVYSLALVILEAARDERVRKAESLADNALEILKPKITPSPRALGMSVPDALESLFASALSIDPQRRPKDAGDFWTRLAAALAVPAPGTSATNGSASVEPSASGPVTRKAELLADEAGLTREMPDPRALPAHVREYLAKQGPRVTGPMAEDATVSAPYGVPSDSGPTPIYVAPVPKEPQRGQTLPMRATPPPPEPSFKGGTLALSGPQLAAFSALQPAPVAPPPDWALPPIRPTQPSPAPHAPFPPSQALPPSPSPSLAHPQPLPQPQSPSHYPDEPVAVPTSRTWLWVLVAFLALGVVVGGVAMFVLMRR